jgi:integrase
VKETKPRIDRDTIDSEYTSGEYSLNRDEVHDVLDATTRPRDEMLLKIAVWTGMRRSDIVRAAWANFYPEENTFYYREKKKSGVHRARLTDGMVNELKRYKHTDDTNDVWLFDGQTQVKHGKGRVSSRTAYNIFKRSLENAGYDSRPFHALRATCIKLCQKAGWTVAETAEHVNDTIETIQRHYMTPTPGEMKSTMEEKPILG